MQSQDKVTHQTQDYSTTILIAMLALIALLSILFFGYNIYKAVKNIPLADPYNCLHQYLRDGRGNIIGSKKYDAPICCAR